MNRCWMIALALLVLLPTALGARENSPAGPMIVTGHPNYPPFSWREGERLVGVGPELAAIILQRLNVPYVNRYMGPWKRTQEMARHGRADLLVDIYHNLTRETYLDYSEAYCTDPSSVFTLRDKTFLVGSRHDLVGRHGVTTFGDSFGEEMDRFMEQRLRITRVYSPREMFDTLMAGKADYLLMGYYMVQIYGNQQGVSDKLRLAHKELVVEKMYFAFSKKSTYRHLVPAFNRQIQALRAEGRIDTMIDAYLERYLRENHE